MLHRYAFCALALLCYSGHATALEIGFESLVSVNASDNVFGANSGEETEGQVGYAQFGVFGEQKGTVLRGAFSGELYSQKQLDDPDDDFNAITQFIGAAEFNITPRSFSWYVGDILGGVRTDDALQPIDDLDNTRRNVFVTGPTFSYDIDSFSRFNARVLYVNQSQDDLELESLYNASAGWEVDTDRGNTWGLLLGNIYTDNPEANLEGDFNRFSLSGLWRRDRGRNAYEAQLGATRYDTDEESVDGVNARFLFTRQLGLESNINLSFTRDLRDQTLTAVETLIDTGTGLTADGDGFFDETRIDLTYDFTSADTTFDIGVGAGQSDFRLLAGNAGFVMAGDLEDRNNFYAYTNYSYRLNPRTRVATSLSFAQQDFINREDNSQSVLGIASVVRRLSRSFELEFGYRVNVSEGVRTRSNATGADTLEDIDVTENRFTVGLRWAPPTRASKDLTIELKSLLQ